MSRAPDPTPSSPRRPRRPSPARRPRDRRPSARGRDCSPDRDARAIEREGGRRDHDSPTCVRFKQEEPEAGGKGAPPVWGEESFRSDAAVVIDANRKEHDGSGRRPRGARGRVGRAREPAESRGRAFGPRPSAERPSSQGPAKRRPDPPSFLRLLSKPAFPRRVKIHSSHDATGAARDDASPPRQIRVESDGKDPPNDDGVVIHSLHNMLKKQRDETSPPRQIEIDQDGRERKSDQGATTVEAALNGAADAKKPEVTYEIGQNLIDEKHSLPFKSTSQASPLLLKLPLDSPLFVKRTSGDWTYAILADKTMDDKGRISLVVYLKSGGRNRKILERNKWSRCLRLVNGHVASEVLLSIADVVQKVSAPPSPPSRSTGGKSPSGNDRHVSFESVGAKEPEATRPNPIKERPSGFGAKLARMNRRHRVGPTDGAASTSATIYSSIRSATSTSATIYSSFRSIKSASFHGDARPSPAPVRPAAKSASFYDEAAPSSVAAKVGHAPRLARAPFGEARGVWGINGLVVHTQTRVRAESQSTELLRTLSCPDTHGRYGGSDSEPVSYFC